MYVLLLRAVIWPAAASICNMVLSSSTLDFYINGIPAAKDFVINNQGHQQQQDALCNVNKQPPMMNNSQLITMMMASFF